MKSDNITAEKSYAFAKQIVVLCLTFQKQNKEFVLSKQLLRSGTAVGALLEEAVGAQTTKDFYHKLTIAYKEARETKYWLRLLRDTKLLEEKEANSFLEKAEELLKLIGSIRRTLKDKHGF